MKPKTKRLLAFAFAVTLIIWQLLSLGAIFATMSGDNLFVMRSADGSALAIDDFVEFYAAGKIAVSPQRAHAYDAQVQRLAVESIAGAPVRYLTYIQYFPTVFVLMAPFSRLPLLPSWLLWSISGMILAMVALYFLARQVGANAFQRFFILVVSLCSYPAWIAFRTGQISWLLLALVALYCSFYLRKKDIAAGVTLSLLSIKPQYLPLLFVPALAMRRYKLIVAAFVGEILLLAVASLFIGLKSIVDYPHVLFSAESSQSIIGVRPDLMVSLRGVLTDIGVSQHLAMQMCFVGMLLIALLLFFVAQQKESNYQDSQKQLLSLALLGALVFSAHTHLYDCILVAAAGVLTLPSCLLNLSKRSNLLCLLLMVAYPVITWSLLFVLLPQATTFVVTGLNAVLFLVVLGQYFCSGANFHTEVIDDKANGID